MTKKVLENYLLPTDVANCDEFHFLVFGSGGNGSFLIEELGKVAFALKATQHISIELGASDFDRVEMHNIPRSRFVLGDCELSKSQIAVSSANLRYHQNWNAYDNDEEMVSDFKGKTAPIFAFLCTDSVVARERVRSLLNRAVSAQELKNVFIVDLGNDLETGQICLTDPKGVLSEIESGNVSENRQTVTCGQLGMFSEQGLMINSTLANLTAQLIWDLIRKKSISYSQVFVNLEHMTVTSRLA